VDEFCVVRFNGMEYGDGGRFTKNRQVIAHFSQPPYTFLFGVNFFSQLAWVLGLQ